MENCIELNKGKNAEVRLYVIHHAGGSHMLFRKWAEYLPDWIECVALELPGRGISFGQPFALSMENVFERFLASVETDKPYAFFGHSMGAMISYELAIKLQKLGIPPVWLCISAFQPPHIKNKDQLFRSQLNDEELLNYLCNLGGLEELFFRDGEVAEVMLGIVRNDFEILDTWKMSISNISENTKVSIFAGSSDVILTPKSTHEWRSYINNFGEYNLFDGDHFYLNKNQSLLVSLVENELSIFR